MGKHTCLLAGLAMVLGLSRCSSDGAPTASGDSGNASARATGAGDGSESRGAQPPAEPELEPYRPLYHFTTPSNWINDPNGPVYFREKYHLFYQYNPSGDVWGNISWGHAVSEDRLHWQHLPIAIPASGDTLIFSGSVVADSSDETALCEDDAGCIVAIYSASITDPVTLQSDQTINLAASDADATSFVTYPKNPVLDAESPDFRDPNVFWHPPSERWIMSVALAVDRKIALYASPDLREWTLLSEFGPAGATEGIWECPVLIELPVDGDPTETRWMLKVDTNPGHVAGGSGAQYFVGSFDGTTFSSGTPAEALPLWVDWGRDFYCALQWTNEPLRDGERTWIAWMSNWSYAEQTPTSPWRGAMSVPRAFTLRETEEGPRLAQRPISSLDAQRGAMFQGTSDDLGALSEDLQASGVLGRANDFLLSIRPGTAREVGLRVRVGEGEETVVGYDVASQRLFVDRTRSGAVDFADGFPDRHEAPVPLVEGALTLRVLVDSSSVEVFAHDGLVVLTDLVFPSPESTDAAVYAEEGAVESATLEVFRIQPALPVGTIGE